MRKPITIWETSDRHGFFYHNHIEDGHGWEREPRPMSDEQRKAWKGNVWRAIHGYLMDGMIVEERLVNW